MNVININANVRVANYLRGIAEDLVRICCRILPGYIPVFDFTDLDFTRPEESFKTVLNVLDEIDDQLTKSEDTKYRVALAMVKARFAADYYVTMSEDTNNDVAVIADTVTVADIVDALGIAE